MSAEVGAGSVFELIAGLASSSGAELSAAEMAVLAEREGFGAGELEAVRRVFGYLAESRREKVIQTLLKLSRLPQREPKTFDNFDFARIRGGDVAELERLRTLSSLHARRNIAFVGPGGIGKTHLAQAYGRECCLNGFKTYYLKASELRDKLSKAAESGNAARAVGALVKPSCLIIDEVGRCTFDRSCTNMFFDVVDRRYEKEGPNTMILTSNTPVVNWDEFFTGDDTLLCTLDRVFDKASVFMMRGASFRGAECETFSVEALPSIAKLKR